MSELLVLMKDWYPPVILGLMLALVVWSYWSPPPPPDADEKDCFGRLSDKNNHKGGA